MRTPCNQARAENRRTGSFAEVIAQNPFTSTGDAVHGVVRSAWAGDEEVAGVSSAINVLVKKIGSEATGPRNGPRKNRSSL